MANLFSKLFNLGKNKRTEVSMTAELERLCQFEKKLNDLLEQDIYIARSDYKELRDENASIYSHFKVLQDSKTLNYYCLEHGVEEERNHCAQYGSGQGNEGGMKQFLVLEHLTVTVQSELPGPEVESAAHGILCVIEGNDGHVPEGIQTEKTDEGEHGNDKYVIDQMTVSPVEKNFGFFPGNAAVHTGPSFLIPGCVRGFC